jgi:hypothetical protein
VNLRGHEHAAVVIHLDPTAATTHWDGQRLDLGYAVAVLAHRRQRA